MAWATVNLDSTFSTRMTADVIRAADFFYLNNPNGVVRATTHHDSVTDQGGNVWTGVGRFGFIRPEGAEISAAAQRWEVGLTGLPRDSSANEPDLIGVEAQILLGNADATFANWKLDPVFTGFVQSAGKFTWRRDDEDRRVLDVSLTIGDQKNPRQGLRLYHAMGDGYWGTAGEHLHTVRRSDTWPG